MDLHKDQAASGAYNGPIRVVHVTGSLSLGGSMKLTKLVAGGLQRNGMDCTVVNLGSGGPYAEDLRNDGVEVVELNLKRSFSLQGFAKAFRAMIRLIRFLQETRPRIVHTHLFLAGLMGRIAAKVAGVPIVISTCHRIFYPRIQPAIERLLSLITDSWVVDSWSVARLISRRMGAPTHKIAVIYNGIETQEFGNPTLKVEARRVLGIPCQAKAVGIIAHFVPDKGHRHYLKAFQSIIHEIPEALLVLVGSGPLQREMEELTSTLGLSNFVVFLGARRDLATTLSALDLVVLPSAWEGFGLVLAEAMYLGLPVISTTVGGSAEIVSNLETGILVPFGDVARLRTATLLLLQDALVAKQFGENGRERVERMFTQDRMIQSYVTLYRKLVG